MLPAEARRSAHARTVLRCNDTVLELRAVSKRVADPHRIFHLKQPAVGIGVTSVLKPSVRIIHKVESAVSEMGTVAVRRPGRRRAREIVTSVAFPVTPIPRVDVHRTPLVGLAKRHRIRSLVGMHVPCDDDGSAETDEEIFHVSTGQTEREREEEEVVLT